LNSGFKKYQRYENQELIYQEQRTIENKKFIKATISAIENLPPRAKHIYLLSRQDGLTYNEIAEVMEISTKTVESQMSRALSILHSQLRDDFPDSITEETIAKIFSINSETR